MATRMMDWAEETLGGRVLREDDDEKLPADDYQIARWSPRKQCETKRKQKQEGLCVQFLFIHHKLLLNELV